MYVPPHPGLCKPPGSRRAWKGRDRMTRNVGPVDRGLRIVVGLLLLSLLVVLDGPARWFGLIGLLPLLTAFLRWCPAYGLVGINTCPRG